MSLPGFAALTPIASITTLGLVASLACALDPEQQFSPMVIGANPVPEVPLYDVLGRIELRSKQVTHGVTVHDDAVSALAGKFRAYGFGVEVGTVFALGQAQNPNRPSQKTSPFELVQLDIKIDYVVEYRDQLHPSIPVVQIRPYFHAQTFPNQPKSNLKNFQRWLGVETWYAIPAVEGFEIGASLAGNQWRGFNYVDAGFGAREFRQQDPWDLAFWQILNYNNKAFKQDLIGRQQGGFSTLDLGARVTLPLPWNESWVFLQTKMEYWVEKKDRDILKTTNQDSGNFEIAIGMDWRPE